MVMHGHEPLLPELLVVASQDPEIQAYAKSKGAKGINLAGMCCSANEVLMRHGIPVAGNFLQQELAIVTGAVDAMVVDVQCEMQSLADVAKCYHTKVITTNPRAQDAGGDAHRIRRAPRPGCGQKDPAGSHRQLPQPQGKTRADSLGDPSTWWSGSATRPSIIF